MSEILGGHIEDLERRKQFIEDNCDKIEEKSYMKPYTDEDIVVFKDELAETSISIDNEELKKKQLIAMHKLVIDPLKNQKLELLNKIRNKSEYVKESCYKYVDHAKNVVNYYNGEGIIVETRPIRADEKQTTIFQLTAKTGTNN